MLIPSEPIWIDQDDQLAELCTAWRQQAAIAVDTEFMRSDTFYPIAGLLQVGDGKGCYLIDPLAISDLEPLRALMLIAFSSGSIFGISFGTFFFLPLAPFA